MGEVETLYVCMYVGYVCMYMYVLVKKQSQNRNKPCQEEETSQANINLHAHTHCVYIRWFFSFNISKVLHNSFQMWQSVPNLLVNY